MYQLNKVTAIQEKVVWLYNKCHIWKEQRLCHKEP